MNWLLIILLGIAAIALIVFLVLRNLKDEKEFEDQLKKDYRKPRDEEGDIEIEKEMK
jgi:low affinity Fe/Cu permease